MREALATQLGLADNLVDPAPDLVVAPLAGPGLAPEHAAGLDLILEGFLLHHGRARHLDLPDAGRRVLAGDYCYARGLVWVAAAGDLQVIELLADLVAMSASLVSTGDRDGLAPLWRATVAAIARDDPAFTLQLRDAKDALRVSSDIGAITALAAGLPASPGLEEALVA